VHEDIGGAAASRMTPSDAGDQRSMQGCEFWRSVTILKDCVSTRSPSSIMMRHSTISTRWSTPHMTQASAEAGPKT